MTFIKFTGVFLVLFSLVTCDKKPARDSFVFSSKVRPQTARVAVGRVYLIHGYYQTLADMQSGTYAILADRLYRKGYEIVWIDWPALAPAITARDFRNDQGKTYVTAFKTYMKSVNRSLAPVPKTIIGGFSFGGLHAVWANEVIPAQAVFANMSVVVVSRLSEFSGLDTTFADMPSHVIPANFWLSYGRFDERVNGLATAADFAGRRFLHSYNCGHTTTPQQVTDILRWLSNSQDLR